MAERRMFAKTVIDSDAFLDMPLSTQALYFHLSMRADDEGFINSPKKIQRIIGASEDDLKLLALKKFIIPFESGIVVIKHWKIHNYIRGDRLQKTKYQDERQLLDVKENGSYTLSGSLKEIPAAEQRKIAYKNSELPYSFTYKIRRAFEGKTCPVCGCKMTSSTKLAMPTIQHNEPISKGGQHVLENISVICESCNISIQDNATDSLNNEEVVKAWKRILYAEEHKIDWFYHPELLENIDVSQMSDICQSDVSIGKVRLDKDSIDKVRLGKDINSSEPKKATEPTQYADVPKIPLNNGDEWQMPLDLYNECKTIYPAVDIDKELGKMRMWCISNPTKRKTPKGISRFVNTWLSKEQDRYHGNNTSGIDWSEIH